MICTYYTHTGKVRKNNEDALLINDILVSQKDLDNYQLINIKDQSKYIFIVADGMGGHNKGEVASFLVLDYFRKNFKNIHSKEDLILTLKESKSILNRYAKEHPEAYSLGTVIAGLMIINNTVILFNIGDARIYLYKPNDSFLERISKDHSVVEELKDAGIITEEEVRFHPQKHIITSCIAGDNESSIKSYFIKEYQLDFFYHSYVLLCSDGLWEMLSKEELLQCFNLNESSLISECLIKKSFFNGAFDNVSFILIKFKT